MFELEKTTTRKAFGKTIQEMAREDPAIMAVSGDSVNSMVLDSMQAEMPDRVINTGIAEQNAMNIAAGMAATGLKPVIAGFAPFMTMRALEQLRTFICYPNLNVKVAGGMSGLSAAAEGVTHQGLEDVGILRTIPNMVITAPADAAATAVITRAIMEHVGPAYIRLHKGPVYRVYDEGEFTFEIGKGNLLREGTDVAILASGAVLYRAIQAADELSAQGVSVFLVDMACIKPLDKELVLRAAKETGAIVTVEDHQVTGGLGGAVCEYLSGVYPTIVERMGVPDVFTQSGDHFELLDHYGLRTCDIVSAALRAVEKKRS